MKRRRWFLPIFVPMLGLLAGCPVTAPQDTPVDPLRRELASGADYWLYVPSDYTPERSWPLAITLHGTHGWDGAKRQIDDWKSLAEEHGFIVAAPVMRSVQGILPVFEGLWKSDLKKDEARILAMLDELGERYAIDERTVLLTGFSAGGYPMYYTGLRNPERFRMLIARKCNSSVEIFESIELTDAARRLPIFIYWGKSDPVPIRDQSWQAIRWLGERGFTNMDYDKIEGGHFRRSSLAVREWFKYLPSEYRDATRAGF